MYLGNDFLFFMSLEIYQYPGEKQVTKKALGEIRDLLGN
jgi:hypothetical protein